MTEHAKADKKEAKVTIISRVLAGMVDFGVQVLAAPVPIPPVASTLLGIAEAARARNRQQAAEITQQVFLQHAAEIKALVERAERGEVGDADLESRVLRLARENDRGSQHPNEEVRDAWARFAARSMFIDTDDLTFFDVSKALDAMTGLDYTYLEIVAEYQKRGVCMALSTEGTLIAMGVPREPWKGGLYRAATRAFMARKNPDWRPRIGATVEKLMALGLLSRPEHREERREVVDLFGTRVERAPQFRTSDLPPLDYLTATGCTLMKLSEPLLTDPRNPLGVTEGEDPFVQGFQVFDPAQDAGPDGD